MNHISNRLYARASARRIPLGGTFELTPVCNFACKMCYVRRTPAQIKAAGGRILDWHEWLEMGKTCVDAGMLYLLLTGGEPFAYPHFRELYEGLHDMHILLSINTNGSLINETTIEWLKQRAPYRVNVTLYGAGPEAYERLCGDPTGYERALWSIRALHEAGIPVVVNCSLTPQNVQDLETIEAITREIDVPCRLNSYMFPPVRREREATDSRFTSEEAAETFLRRLRCQYSDDAYQSRIGILLDELNRCEQQRSDMSASTDPPAHSDWGAPDADTDVATEQMVCRAGRSTFWISWEGKMTACGIVKFPVELDPFARSFQECWEELTETVRHATVLAGCHNCPRRPICRPCVAMIHAETGDVNAKAPYLCSMSEHLVSLLRQEGDRLQLSARPTPLSEKGDDLS